MDKIGNNTFYNARDIVKLAFQFQETEFIPFVFKISLSQTKALTKYYGNDQWKKQIKNNPYRVPIKEFSYNLTGVDLALALEHGVDDLFNTKKNSIHKDSFGCTWKIGEPSHLMDWPLHEDKLGNYKLPNLDNYFSLVRKKWLAEFLKTKNQFRIPIHIFGLFERAWTLRSFNNFLMDLAANEKFAEELLEQITEWMIHSVDLMAGIPIDGIMFTDDHAYQQGMMMGEEKWRKLFKPRWKRIYDRAHKYGFYTLMHMCGNNTSIVSDLIEIGLDCMESCQPEAEDIYKLKKHYGKDIRFWGGLGVQKLIPFGKPDEVRKETKRLKIEMGKGGGYILSTAKPFFEQAPIENIAAYLEEAITSRV